MSALLTETAAAHKLGVTPRQLRLLRRLGGGPTHLHAGGMVRYDPLDLLDWCRTWPHAWSALMPDRSTPSLPGPPA